MIRHLSYREQFYSVFPPDEVLRLLHSCLLPADIPTWRDDYRAGAELLFQGSVAADSFKLLRFRKKPVYREAGPFPILGQVSPYEYGSYIELRYNMHPEGWFILKFQSVLVGVLILCGAGAAWFHTRAFPWFSAFLLSLLPIYIVVGVYFSLYREATKSRPLLVDLLQLRSSP